MASEKKTRSIPLTQGYLALVDEEDYEELSRFHVIKDDRR